MGGGRTAKENDTRDGFVLVSFLGFDSHAIPRRRLFFSLFLLFCPLVTFQSLG
jgi:hypothetical protein